MSKKHKNQQYQAVSSSGNMPHAAEYRIIKMDLVKVIILNAAYLAVILALYYSNQKSHFLDNWFARILHF